MAAIIYFSGLFLTILLGLLICYFKPETVKSLTNQYYDFMGITILFVILWPIGLMWFIGYLLSLLVNYIVELGMKRKNVQND